MKKVGVLFALLSASATQAYPVVTFQWDEYQVTSTQNTGANKFILETKVGAGVWVAAPPIMPITETMMLVDLAGRSGATVTGHIKACRPGTFASPPTAEDECSVWSNEAIKTLPTSPPEVPAGLKIQ